ncbi:MAG: DUF5686 family protein [Flavisolibacter sp.]
MRFLQLLLFILLSDPIYSQVTLRAVVIDSSSRQPLPFATIQTRDKKGLISDINGFFHLTITHHQVISFSYAGHISKQLFSTEIGDTVYLAGHSKKMETVVVRSQDSRIRRIINSAISRRDDHNPDLYQQYACKVYYKMTLDMGLMDHVNRDSLFRAQDSLDRLRNPGKQSGRDSSNDLVKDDRHLLMTETFSKRIFKKPRLQEIVLASRFSGLDKTYFANIITDVLPFHVYHDYINLNSKDYVNPVSRGWEHRYRFYIEEEVLLDNDTVFVLSYQPKEGKKFNALRGTVYINSNGFAITHITGTNQDDFTEDRVTSFEQIYQLMEGKWFPAELNYDFLIKKVPAPFMKVSWNGHSVIDAVSFEEQAARSFDKTHPVKLHDSVDLRSEGDWTGFRKDSISQKELNTYRYMDSLSRNTPMGAAIKTSGKLVQGLWPIGKLDLDLSRLIASNRYEGLRLGLGLYTGDKISRQITFGGWAGYGFRDKKWKYGFSASIYPKSAKENWMRFSFQDDYKLPGRVNLHPELSSSLVRGWLFQQVDRSREFAFTSNIRAGYWELRPSLTIQNLDPLHYTFLYEGKKFSSFETRQAGINLRYAPLEKRYPFFDLYFSSGKNRLPIFYFSLNTGKVKANSYEAGYSSALAAISYERRTNRWGKDYLRLEAGILKSSQALPKSLLFAGNGFRRGGNSFYTWGGFLTMRPYDFYTDRYASVLYKHDFDYYFWDHSISKPFPSIAHNMLYGKLSSKHSITNAGAVAPENIYHETGILLNQILRFDARFADMNINAGYFYHWTNEFNKKNGVWVLGTSFSF